MGGGSLHVLINYFSFHHSLHAYFDTLSLPIQLYWETSVFPSCTCWTPTLGHKLLVWIMPIHKRTTSALTVHPLGWMEPSTQSRILSIIVFFPSALWGLCKLQFSTFVWTLLFVWEILKLLWFYSSHCYFYTRKVFWIYRGVVKMVQRVHALPLMLR